MKLLILLFNKNTHFFKSIGTMNIQNFYLYSWKVLTSSYIFKITGYVDQPWKKINAKKLVQYDIKKMLLLFNKINHDQPYSKFNDNVFLSYIIEYFDDTKLVRNAKK